MKCICGAEIPRDAKFCGHCGRPNAVPVGTRCGICGAPLRAGARFCGHCGQPVSKPESHSSAGQWTEKIRQSLHSASEWLSAHVTNRILAKRVAIIVLVIGLCVFWTGLCGRIVSGALAGGISKRLASSGMNSDLGFLLSGVTGSVLSKLVNSLIRNDFSGFLAVVKQITGSVPDNALMNSALRPAFNEFRTGFRQQMGLQWPMLLVMAHSGVLLFFGIILSAAGGAVWFLLGGKLSDVKTMRMNQVLCIGAGWMALVLCLTFALMLTM